MSADVLLDTASINSAWIDSQIGILKLDSAKVALSVVRDLHLDRDAEFVGSDAASEKPKSKSKRQAAAGTPVEQAAASTPVEQAPADALEAQAASVLASRIEVKRDSAGAGSGSGSSGSESANAGSGSSSTEGSSSQNQDEQHAGAERETAETAA